MEDQSHEMMAMCGGCGARIREGESLCPECEAQFSRSKTGWTVDITDRSTNILTVEMRI